MPVYPPKFQSWLKAFVDDRDAASGTVHLHLGGHLDLAAAVDVGLKLRRDLQRLRPGHKLAGAALERGAPVVGGSFLGDDGARAAALPVRNAAGEIRAVVSVAFDDRDVDDDTLGALSREVSAVPSI